MRNATRTDPTTPPLVPRLLAALVGCVCRAPRLILCLTAVSLALCAWLACTRLQYRTQRDEMISPTKEVQQRWRAYLQEFGQDDDMVVVVQGDSSARPQMIEAIETLAGRIRAQPETFDRIFYKVDLRCLRNRALLFLDREEIERIRRDLTRMKPLLENPLAWQLFSLRGMVNEAATRLGQQNSAENASLQKELLAVTQAARVALVDPARYRNPWTGVLPRRQGQDQLAQPQYFFSGDGQLAFLLVRPLGRKDEFVGSFQSVQQLRQLVAAVAPEFGELRIGVTGLPVLEADEMVASQRDSTSASWIALVGVAFLYLLIFRSLRAPFLTVTTLLVGTVWALGWLTLTVGHLNLLSSTFAVMLIGMGDYGVLWVTRYQQERAAGLVLLPALEATARGVGPSILTASLTTGLAFYAAMLADFMAVAELGWIAGSGVVLCGLACFLVLPPLIVVLDGRRELAEERHLLPFDPESHSTPPVWLPGLARRPRLVLVGGVLLLALLATQTLRLDYDHNLLNLQSHQLDSVKWERTLIAHTAGASWHALSHTPSREHALELKGRFEKLPTVSRVVEIASLVPSDQEAKLPLLHDVQRRLTHLPPRTSSGPLLPSSPAALCQELEKLCVCLDKAQPATVSLAREAAALRTEILNLPAATATDRLAQFERRLLRDLRADLHNLRAVATPEPIQVSDLPPSLRERYLSPNGRWLLRVFGKESLWEYAPLAQFVASVQSVDATATGKPFTTLEGLRAMKSGFQRAGLLALLVIVVVLSLDFRSLGPVLLALAPLLAAVVLALGLLGLCGFTLNPANMIALPLIVGVGVDNGVHVLHDFLDRQRGRPYLLRRSTALGILVAGLTTMLGFGALILSSHRGLSGLGLILALGVGFSLLASLVFLPALLHLWSRRRPEATVEEVPGSARAA